MFVFYDAQRDYPFGNISRTKAGPGGSGTTSLSSSPPRYGVCGSQLSICTADGGAEAAIPGGRVLRRRSMTFVGRGVDPSMLLRPPAVGQDSSPFSSSFTTPSIAATMNRNEVPGGGAAAWGANSLTVPPTRPAGRRKMSLQDPPFIRCRSQSAVGDPSSQLALKPTASPATGVGLASGMNQQWSQYNSSSKPAISPVQADMSPVSRNKLGILFVVSFYMRYAYYGEYVLSALGFMYIF